MAAKKNTTVTAKGGKEYAYYRITRTIGHEWKDGKKVPVKKQFVGASKGNAEQKFKKYQEERIYELQVTSTEVEKDTKIFCWIYNGKIKLWVK